MINHNITQEIFEKHCSSATNADAAVYSSMSGYLDDAASTLYSKLGLEGIDIERTENLSYYVEKAVCLYAYYIAIPHLDLILTPTGFGVVSTANVAPASADRVNRLRQSVLNAYEDTIDTILYLLVQDDTWNQTSFAKSYIHSYFWAADQLRNLYKHDAHRSDLAQLSATIKEAENFLIGRFGYELNRELIDSMRTRSTSSHAEELIELIRIFIIAAMQETNLIALSEPILHYLLSNLSEFPTFENSSAYVALKIVHYENKKQDPCYFFGL